MHLQATAQPRLKPKLPVWALVRTPAPNLASGTILASLKLGEFRATVEVDRDWRTVNWGSLGYGYRYRVYVNGKQAFSDCGSSIIYCQERACAAIASWPSYPPDAQRALLGD